MPKDSFLPNLFFRKRAAVTSEATRPPAEVRVQFEETGTDFSDSYAS